MDWFLYDDGLRHERVKEIVLLASTIYWIKVFVMEISSFD